MVNLTRIYTRTGDNGTTALGDFTRTTKTDSRLVAYADVDEANSAVGVALSVGQLPEAMVTLLRGIQNELFDLGADLSTPVRPEASDDQPGPARLRVQQAYVDRLERACDDWNAGLAPLRSFILPGGTPGAAYLHVARTVVRRAERSTWAALAEHGATMNRLTATYLNRLSDLLFILARAANVRVGDVLWVPGGERREDGQQTDDGQQAEDGQQT